MHIFFRLTFGGHQNAVSVNDFDGCAGGKWVVITHQENPKNVRAEVIMSNRLSERFNISEWFTVRGHYRNITITELYTRSWGWHERTKRTSDAMPAKRRELYMRRVLSRYDTHRKIRPLAPGACVNLTFMIILPCRLKHCATQILYGLIEYMRRDKRHAQRGLHQLRLNLKNSSPIRIIRILCADANRIKWRPHTPLWFWKSSLSIIYQKMVALCCFSSANARILRNCKRINAKPNVPL